MKFNKYWFKPKRFGYGATPTTWEGFVSITFFVICLILISIFLKEVNNIFQYLLFLGVSIVVIILISKKKTDGKWKWNWGRNE